MLRILFTFYVLLLHSAYISNGNDAMFAGGWLGVEFFFLVSGYLMAASEDKLPEFSLGKNQLGKETIYFISKKILNLLPYFTFALIVNFVVWYLPNNLSNISLTRAISGTLNYIGGFTIGFHNNDFFYLGYSWYISAMILAMYVLYPLLRKNRDVFYCILAPLITLFGLGFYAHFYGTLGYVSSNQYLLSSGLIRGIFEIALGCCCYKICKIVKNIKFTKLASHIMSIVLILLIYLVSYRIIYWGNSSIIDFILLFIIALCIILAFSDKCSISFQLSAKLSSFSGNFSLALYICSNCWSYLIARLYPTMPYNKALILYLFLATSCALICMFVCYLCKVFYNRYKNRIIEKFIL